MARETASGASGTDGLAGRLPEPDEEVVDIEPVFPRYLPDELLFGLLRRLRTDQPQSVRNPVDMGVHRDRGLLEGVDEHAVRRLPSDRVKLQQVLHGSWDFAHELVHELPGDPDDVSRLHVVESGGPD